jgi:hypothetical protein
MMENQHKYDVLLATFVAFLMQQTGCSQDAAGIKIATLCAVVQTLAFDTPGKSAEKHQGR